MFQYDKRGPLYIYLYVSVKILEDPIDLYSRLLQLSRMPYDIIIKVA